MAKDHQPRPIGAVQDLPSDFPVVPVLENEVSINAAEEGIKFFDTFNKAVTSSDWSALGDLFADQSWWKDNLTLTFDKRTIQGKDTIVEAWKELVPTRRPSAFTVRDASSSMEMVETQAAFTRFSPEFATLDVPFTFNTEGPSSTCVGIAKLIPHGEKWKVWILTTAIHSLTSHPFASLPRTSPGMVSAAQRGKSSPQGLPEIGDGVLDAIVIGGGCSGLGNAIMMDAANLNVAIFESGDSPGWAWVQRYEAVRLHHAAYMIQLPYYPVPEGFSEYLSGAELGQYMSRAVETLQLPFFAGTEIVSNEWDPSKNVWHVKIRDTRAGQPSAGTILKCKNLVLSNGFLVSEQDPFIPKNLDKYSEFGGIVQHTVQYSNAKSYSGKDVVVVGSGNSAHDVAKDLADNGATSVTMLQRSPTVLFDFKTWDAFVAMLYRGNIPIDTADFLATMMPTGILRDMANMAIGGLVQASEPLYQKLEAKGYLVDRKPQFISRAFEERGRSFYFDAPGAFDLVFDDKIKIVNGAAQRFVKDGVVIKDYKTQVERIIPAGGVVLATGYSDVQLPERYETSGFLDPASAKKVVNVGIPAINDEGELLGQITRSGRKFTCAPEVPTMPSVLLINIIDPHLLFSGIGFVASRWMVFSMILPKHHVKVPLLTSI